MLQPGLFPWEYDETVSNVGKRLLILACSENKKHTPGLIPAVERYDGPMWKVLRSFTKRRADHETNVHVYVLSAEFGLISAKEPIPWYDRVMTEDRAEELRASTLNQLCLLLDEGYNQICLALSKLYLHALFGWENIIPTEVSVTVVDGPMATKQGQLRSWLQGETWKPTEYAPNQRITATRSQRSVILKGIPIHLSRDEVLERARTALATGALGSDNYRDWYALVDEKPVSTKWLVELISGISVEHFDASAARRVLLGLGIDVERAH